MEGFYLIFISELSGGVKDHMVIQGVPSDPSSHDPLPGSDVIATNSYFKASEDILEERIRRNNLLGQGYPDGV